MKVEYKIIFDTEAAYPFRIEVNNETHLESSWVVSDIKELLEPLKWEIESMNEKTGKNGGLSEHEISLIRDMLTAVTTMRI